MNSNKYSYKKEGDDFVLLVNGQIAKTPNGVEVRTSNEELAKRLAKDANETDCNYQSSKTLLCYHYSFLDYEQIEEPDYAERLKNDPKFREDTVGWLGMEDDYLMLGHSSPVWQAVAEYYVDKVLPFLNTLSPHKRMAVKVLQNAYCSIMLPYYIVSWIIAPTDNEEILTVDEFLDLMEEFEEVLQSRLQQLEDDTTITQFDRNNWRSVIETFIFYFTQEKV